MDGFRYNGIHCSVFNVWYIPDEKKRWFPSPEFDVYDANVAGRDGGYYYGSKANIRVFTLNCFYEEIDLETRENIRAWLDKDTAGDLIFDNRPYAVYHVHPTKIVEGTSYNVMPDGINSVMSGTFTITFSAYDPYGYLTKKYYLNLDDSGAAQVCGILEKGQMPSPPDATTRSFTMYNCGTKTCDTLISIGGTGTNIEIMNATNGSFCKLNSLPQTGYLEIDSATGEICVVNGSNREEDFSYHDEGFLTLEPFLPKTFGLIATTTNGSPTITFQAYQPLERDIGRYIQIGSSWTKIISIGNKSVTIGYTLYQSKTIKTDIATLNEITISGDNLNFTKLSVDYFPKIV